MGSTSEVSCTHLYALGAHAIADVGNGPAAHNSKKRAAILIASRFSCLARQQQRSKGTKHHRNQNTAERVLFEYSILIIYKSKIKKE